MWISVFSGVLGTFQLTDKLKLLVDQLNQLAAKTNGMVIFQTCVVDKAQLPHDFGLCVLHNRHVLSLESFSQMAHTLTVMEMKPF